MKTAISLTIAAILAAVRVQFATPAIQPVEATPLAVTQAAPAPSGPALYTATREPTPTVVVPPMWPTLAPPDAPNAGYPGPLPAPTGYPAP